MINATVKFFLVIGALLFTAVTLPAQTLVQEYGDTFISPDNFVTGVSRRGAMDVQKSTGKIVYVYAEKEANPATTKDLMCVIYNQDMTILVNAFKINNGGAGSDQLAPFVLVNESDNSFYVTWYSNQNGNNDVFVKNISFTVTNATSGTVQSGTDVIVNSTLTGEQVIPVMAISYPFSELVVAFRDQSGADGSGSGVFMRRFSFALVPVTTQSVVHTTTTGNQALNSIDIDNNYMVISYTSDHVPANSTDLYVSIFNIWDPPGPTTCTYTLTNGFRVNNYVSGTQDNSHVAINATSNEFAVTWSSNGQDGSGFGVYAKIYTLPTTVSVVKDEFIVNSSTSNNQLLSKAVWEESNRQLMIFFHYSLGTLGTLKYRLFDGNSVPTAFAAVDTEKDLIGGLDTKSYYSQQYNVVYNPFTQRVNLCYDIYDTYSTFNSKVRARTYIFKHPGLITPSFVNSTDLNRNWIHHRVYAEDGSLVNESRQYYDSIGHSTQLQSRNVDAGGTILASARINDKYYRPVIQTMEAPITEQQFTYKTNLITPSGSSNYYSYSDFDNAVTGSNLPGEVNNPKAVDANSLLGKYYSDNNTYESHVGVTGFPYQRTYYNDDVYGGVLSIGVSGETLRMGAGHEVKGTTIPVLNELDHYLQLKKLHFGGTGIPVTTMAFRAMKTVLIDQNGNETISFTDLEGHTIATAAAKGSTPLAMSGDLTYSTSFYYLGANSNLTVSNLKVSSSTDLLEVRDLLNNTLIFSGYEVDFNLFAFSLTSPCQVRSKTPFKLSYTTTSNMSVVTDYTSEESTDFTEGHSAMDIYIKNPASLSFTLSPAAGLLPGNPLVIKITNLTTGAVLFNADYSTFNSSMMPGAGFYRIEIEEIPALSDYNPLNVYLRVNFDFPFSEWSYSFFDRCGNLVGSVAPKGVNLASTSTPKFKSEYTYSTIGEVLTVNDPDRGLSKYVYRKDGSVRFAQDAKQAVTGKFSYINKDKYGRTVESGEYNPALVSSNAKVFVDHRAQEIASTPDPNSVHTILEVVASGGGLESVGRVQVKYIVYDFAASDAPRTQSNLRSHVSCTYKKNVDTDVSYTCKTWFGYDERGRIIWTDQTLVGLGTKTLDYVYTRELLTNIVYQNNVISERFEHRYSYDKMLRRKKVETAAGAGAFQTEVQYYYYLHGPLKRKELGGNVQGMDYVYTVQGWLKGINHPELIATKDPGQDGTGGSLFSKDLFGMSFDYFQNDYYRSNSNVYSTSEVSLASFSPNYNGNIRAVTWQTIIPGAGGNPCQYAYTYDHKNEMLTAVFGSNNLPGYAFTPDAGGKYTTTATYDVNGNLLTMLTTKGSVPSDNYDYRFGAPATPQYTDPEANRLIYLANVSDPNDIRNYQYDEIGQLINETRGSGAQKKVTYDVSGKVIEVRDASNALKVSFEYNERGQRIRKIVYGTVNINTWYVLDIAGNVLSIYDDNGSALSQTEIPIYGAGREGVIQKNGSSLVYTYEIKDHLGNVRVTVDRQKHSNGDAQWISWMDYLPFGEVNPDRHNYGSFGSRYQYQGECAEHDAETEWDAFDLRMYDARIGRWLTADPYGQYWSPYLAMGNNPANSMDPDGGWDYRSNEGSNSSQLYYGGWDGSKYYYGSGEYSYMMTVDSKMSAAVANLVSWWANADAGKAVDGAPDGTEWFDYGATVTVSSKGKPVQGAPSSGSSFSPNRETSTGFGRNMLTGISMVGEAMAYHLEKATVKPSRRPFSQYKKWKIETFNLKGLGFTLGVIGVGLAAWEAHEKGWTIGASYMFYMDLGATIVGSALPPAGFIYGGVRMGMDMVGIDPADMIDQGVSAGVRAGINLYNNMQK